MSALSFIGFNIEIGEEDHEEFAKHCDKEDQIVSPDAGSKSCEEKHKESGKEQKRSLLFYPYNDTADY